MSDEGYSSSVSGFILALVFAASLCGSFFTEELRWYSPYLPFLIRIGIAIPACVFLLITGVKCCDHELPFDWFKGWEDIPYAKAAMACMLFYVLGKLCVWG
jgi:hypothetical protein